MAEPEPEPKLIPAKRVKPKMIDPAKFIGGKNLDKLKDLVKDAESFISTVKGRAHEVEETFDRLRDFTTKFGETVDYMHNIAEINKEVFEKMLHNMERNFNGITEGKDGKQ